MSKSAANQLPTAYFTYQQIEPGLLMEVGLCAFSIRDRLSTAAAPHQQNPSSSAMV